MKRIIICLLILLPLASFAEFIKWVDENGVAHYADSYANVPEKYLDQFDSEQSAKAVGNQNKATALSPATEVNPFILQGRIIDPRNRIRACLMNEGVQSSGKAERPGLQSIFVTAWSNHTIIKTVHPDEDFEFEIFSDKVITHMMVEVSGCGIYYRQEGPWDEDGDFIIDLNKGLFVIDGFVKNSDGTSAAKVLVTAYDEANTQITYRYTGSRGQFTFFVNQPVYMLRSAAEKLQLKKTGPWSRDAHVVITAGERHLFTIQGIVTDIKGNPAGNVFVCASDDKGSQIKTTRTDRSGRYILEVAGPVVSITANAYPSADKTIISGPWQDDETVNITLGQ